MKFETQEQRDAYEILKPVLKETRPARKTEGTEAMFKELDQAAAEFDLYKETLGIKLLSWEHVGLLMLHNGYLKTNFSVAVYSKLKRLGLIDNFNCSLPWSFTEKGYSVLNNLNAMCKEEK